MTSETMTILKGGTEHAAFLRNGTQEIVTVRLLAVREFDKWLQTVDDEPGRIELATGKEKGWADGLTPDSHRELLALAEKLNESDFFAWLRRRAERQERLLPGSSGELGKALMSASPTGSPSAPSAAA